MSKRLFIDHADLEISDMVDYLNEVATLLKEGHYTQGAGWELRDECGHCDGTGKLVNPAHQSGGHIVDETSVDCTLCKGSGLV